MDSKAYYELAKITSDAWKSGKKEVAIDIFNTVMSSKVGIHKLESDDIANTYLRDLHNMLDKLGFEEIMKVSKKRAVELQKPRPAYYQFPMNTKPILS